MRFNFLIAVVYSAIFGAISHTPKNNNTEVEIHTFRDRPKGELDIGKDNVIQFKPMPNDVKDYLDRLNLL